VSKPRSNLKRYILRVLYLIYSNDAFVYNYVFIQNAIVITGCDTGFGEATSLRLAQMGFHVISACYSPEGAARLRGSVSLAVVCDVTKEEDIAALVEDTAQLLAAKKLKLWGLVCNAG